MQGREPELIGSVERTGLEERVYKINNGREPDQNTGEIWRVRNREENRTKSFLFSFEA